jgi:phospholipid/cholesterol/gamma-HCH transport system substrate-binding protein
METRANYVLIGAFTLIAAVVAVLFALWAGRHTTSANWADYEIRFTQAVTGLSTGGAVQYNGITVGTVRELSLAPDDARQVLARIRIQADAPVKEDTVARLQLAGLTGITFIQLSGGSPDSPPRAIPADGSLPRIPAEESALDRLIGASEGITSAANEALVRILELLSDDNARQIREALVNINDFTETLSAERGQLAETLRSVAGASASAERTLTGADATIAELNQTLRTVNDELVSKLPAMSDDLAVALQQFASLAARTNDLLDENGSAIGALGSGGLGQLGPTLLEMQRLLQDLSRTTRRFDRDPSQYLLGGSQPEVYQPQ